MLARDSFGYVHDIPDTRFSQMPVVVDGLGNPVGQLGDFFDFLKTVVGAITNPIGTIAHAAGCPWLCPAARHAASISWCSRCHARRSASRTVATRVAPPYPALHRVGTAKNVHALCGMARAGGTCSDRTGTRTSDASRTARISWLSGLSRLPKLSIMGERPRQAVAPPAPLTKEVGGRTTS